MRSMDAHSFLRRAGGSVGTNFIFAVPPRVTLCVRFVVFAIAFDPEGPEPFEVPFCADILGSDMLKEAGAGRLAC